LRPPIFTHRPIGEADNYRGAGDPVVQALLDALELEAAGEDAGD
jgi:hypothetical protein